MSRRTNTGLEGRGALVVGGTKGIGRAVARAVAEAGATTVLSGRSAGSAAAVAAELGAAIGRTVYGLGADVTQEEQVARLHEEATRCVGTVDALVVAAGGFEHRYRSCDTSLRHWNQTLSLNLTAAFLLARAALPGMDERGWGRVVFIGSGAGRTYANGGNAAYGAAKMGLIGLANSLVADQAPRGVTVNVVVPGATLSERALRVWADQGGPKAIARTVPIGRIAQPEEVAAVVPFLLSDLGAYTTGAVIDICGGR
ncbi:SDR family NAD(P)-dependent oxidoreductase [Streptomyces collinus]